MGPSEEEDSKMGATVKVPLSSSKNFEIKKLEVWGFKYI